MVALASCALKIVHSGSIAIVGEKGFAPPRRIPVDRAGTGRARQRCAGLFLADYLRGMAALTQLDDR